MKDVFSFSDVTLRFLQYAGWFPERRIDPTPYVEFLQAEGYPVHPVVMDFLGRFGGLYIQGRRPFRNGMSGIPSEFHFDVPKVNAAIPENVQNAGEWLNTSLCLIGELDDYITLMMNPTGEVYASFGDVWMVGVSGEEAIEKICTGQEFLKLTF